MQWVQLALAFLGNEQASKLSQKQLEMLGQQLANIQGIDLPKLEQANPDQMGSSAVGSMKSDQGLRGKQLQALATIQNTIDQGGLDLTDRAALEDANGVATNQQHRAREGVRADLSGRGQLNSGADLMMNLDAAQAGSNALRKTGMDTAAMAQRRRLDAINQASNMAGGLREQDWREGETAARAKDIRDERNASAREKAQYYNYGLPQQNFSNAMSKATNQQPAANAYSGGLGAAAGDARANAAGMAGVLGQMNQPAYPTTENAGSTTYNYNPDEYGTRGGAADLSKNDDK